MGLTVSKILVGGNQLVADVHPGWFPDNTQAANLNNTLNSKGCVVIPNFMNPDKCQELIEELNLATESGKVTIDKNGNVGAANQVSFLELLIESNAALRKVIGESILPTYTYVKSFKSGSIVSKHVERHACEISLCINLGPQKMGGSSWVMSFQQDENNIVEVEAGVGDAILYYGNSKPHWRDMFYGEQCVLAYLHYVKARGPSSMYYFDRQP